MEKRHYKRIPVQLKAEIVSKGKKYAGLIENVSEGGLEYLITSSFVVSKDFTLQKMIDLDLIMPSGQALNLRCEVRWFLRGSLSENTLTLGMKILDPSNQYKEYIQSLDSKDTKRTIG